MSKPKAAPKPVAKPVPVPKKSGAGLKIHPDAARAAVAVLEDFVRERAALSTDKARLGDTVAAVRLFDALYKFKEELAERVKTPLEKAYDTLRFGTIPEMMDSAGITNITVEGVGRCNVQDDVQLTVLEKDGLYGWLIDHELEDMVTKTVNAQTLAAFFRKRLREAGENQEEPELPSSDLVKITPVVRASITRS